MADERTEYKRLSAAALVATAVTSRSSSGDHISAMSVGFPRQPDLYCWARVRDIGANGVHLDLGPLGQSFLAPEEFEEDGRDLREGDLVAVTAARSFGEPIRVSRAAARAAESDAWANERVVAKAPVLGSVAGLTNNGLTNNGLLVKVNGLDVYLPGERADNLVQHHFYSFLIGPSPSSSRFQFEVSDALPDGGAEPAPAKLVEGHIYDGIVGGQFGASIFVDVGAGIEGVAAASELWDPVSGSFPKRGDAIRVRLKKLNAATGRVLLDMGWRPAPTHVQLKYKPTYFFVGGNPTRFREISLLGGETAESELSLNMIVPVRILEITKNGATVAHGKNGNEQAFIPRNRMGDDRRPLDQRFRVGEVLEAMVIDVDGRMEFSLSALEKRTAKEVKLLFGPETQSSFGPTLERAVRDRLAWNVDETLAAEAKANEPIAPETALSLDEQNQATALFQKQLERLVAARTYVSDEQECRIYLDDVLEAGRDLYQRGAPNLGRALVQQCVLDESSPITRKSNPRLVAEALIQLGNLETACSREYLAHWDVLAAIKLLGDDLVANGGRPRTAASRTAARR
ncbi:MAG: hypothetical protein QM759_09000 [Terricaulis sp.]